MGNIVFIGLYGSEKSRLGKELSSQLKWSFYDTDAMIEKREGRKLREICELYGENYYLKREEEILKEVTQLENAVIAMGDASPLGPQSLEKLREKGTVVYIKAPLEGIDSKDIRCLGRYGAELKMTLNSLDRIYHQGADVVIESHETPSALETLRRMNLFNEDR
ncbi:MAG: hypothetical protein AVO33_10870 [delta proteobacterium ML8_F1]|nr:MAG: hypothetical protein AVO33_10870 [delta proteobacterium ML8_F1]